MKTFEESIMEYLKEIAYVSYEFSEEVEKLTGKAVEKVYCYADHEYSWGYSAFLKIDGVRHELGNLGFKNKETWEFVGAIQRPMRSIYYSLTKAGKPGPTTIRVITDLREDTVDVRYGYEKLPTARQIEKGVEMPGIIWREHVDQGGRLVRSTKSGAWKRPGLLCERRAWLKGRALFVL